MANIWRRIVEAMTVLGFAISFWAMPQPELKWMLGGASASILMCILLYEILLVRRDRELLDLGRVTGRALAEKDCEIRVLKEEIEKRTDPELMTIYKEDERERLRLEREFNERARISQQEALDDIRKGFVRNSQMVDEWARERLGLGNAVGEPKRS